MTSEGRTSNALESLPIELYPGIIQHLKAEDAGKFRLCCRIVNSKTVHAYADLCFTWRTLVLDIDGLKTLLKAIDANPKFGSAVRHLRIQPALPAESDEDVLGSHAQLFNIAYGGVGTLLLHKIFQRVENLRDVEYLEWNYQQYPGRYMSPSSPVYMEAIMVSSANVRAIFGALITSGIQLESLVLPGILPDSTSGVYANVFRVTSSFANSFLLLRSLSLWLSTCDEEDTWESTIESVIEVLRYATGLQQLVLGFDRGDITKLLVKRMAELVYLPRLSSLYFQDINCHEKDLSSFLKGHREMIVLQLIDIELRSGSLINLFTTIKNYMNPEQIVFEGLAQNGKQAIFRGICVPQQADLPDDDWVLITSRENMPCLYADKQVVDIKMVIGKAIETMELDDEEY